MTANDSNGKLVVPKWDNQPCYKCGSLERGISNFNDEAFIINCHKCNVTIARGYFNTDHIEVFTAEPDDLDFIEEVVSQ